MFNIRVEQTEEDSLYATKQISVSHRCTTFTDVSALIDIHPIVMVHTDL